MDILGAWWRGALSLHHSRGCRGLVLSCSIKRSLSEALQGCGRVASSLSCNIRIVDDESIYIVVRYYISYYLLVFLGAHHWPPSLHFIDPR